MGEERVEKIIHDCFRDGVYIRDIKETDLSYLFDELERLKEFNSECEDRYKLMESDRDYGLDEIKRLKAELDKG